jgi:addiction module HigA family antidote
LRGFDQVSVAATRRRPGRLYSSSANLFVKRGKIIAMAKRLPSIHPGEVLREDFLAPLQLSPLAVARRVGVPRTRIERLVNEQTAITADTALRLAKVLGTTAAFWIGLQAQYDIERAEDKIGTKLKKIVPVARDTAVRLN